MIRINLLRSQTTAAKRDRALIPRREAIAAAVLLGAAIGALLYLASRTDGDAASSAVKGPLQAAPTPLPAPAAEKIGQKSEQPAPVQPPPQEAAKPEPPAQSAPQPPGQPAATSPEACGVTGVKIQAQGDSLTVRVEANTEIRHRSFELSGPSRIVVDVPGCQAALPGDQSLQSVEHPLLHRVRASQFSVEPAVFRVVLDVSAIPSYQIRAAGRGLEIHVLGSRP
jgi:hypothetical protein